MRRYQTMGSFRSMGHRVARHVYQSLPPTIRADFDYYYRRENFVGAMGGAFNGQKARRRLVTQLLHSVDLGMICETGTYLGSSTAFFADHFHGKIVTIEVDPYYHRFATLRLRSAPHVYVVHSDSVGHLKRLAQDRTKTSLPSLFYLDAHWYEYLPLRDELALIFGGWKKAVVLIDDFEVPDDPGYGFDDYGEGKRLCLNYLTPLGLEQMHVFFPSASSAEETGSCRGCVVLTLDARMACVLSTLRVLRPVETRG